jgi:hypothetical protein
MAGGKGKIKGRSSRRPRGRACSEKYRGCVDRGVIHRDSTCRIRTAFLVIAGLRRSGFSTENTFSPLFHGCNALAARQRRATSLRERMRATHLQRPPGPFGAEPVTPP